MNKLSLFFFINRIRGVKYSFNKKENLYEKVLYFYFTFFKNFKQSSLIKKIINYTSKKTRFSENSLNQIQENRLELKSKTENIYAYKKKLLKDIEKNNEILQNLKKEGYVNISNFFNIDSEKFIKETKSLKYFNSQVPLQSDLVEKVPDNTSNYFSLRPDLEDINVFFKDFLKSKSLKYIIDNYLGSKSYLYSINTMLTKPSEKKHSVTNLHRDYDDKHFLVLFIYWTDTAKDDGSTFFIPGSHLLDNKNLNDGIFLEGKKGSVFLIDTFGWHSGNKNLKKDRLVSWLRFSCNQLNTASYDNKEYLFFDYYNSLWNS